MKKEKILISACLVGHNCRYDGKNKPLKNLAEYASNSELVPVCPEVEGGLSVPRPKAWIKSGTGADVLKGKAIVVDEHGHDLTANFIAGAKHTLELARANNVETAILKSKSPSCGRGKIYNSEEMVNGAGVTAELLLRHGIEVITV